MLCVGYYQEQGMVVCYCLSGDVSETINKKCSIYVNDKLISSNAEITKLSLKTDIYCKTK